LEILCGETAIASAAPSTAWSSKLLQGGQDITTPVHKSAPQIFKRGWMLLCIPQKTSTKFIHHLELPKRLTDQELFHNLRRAYEKKRPPWLLRLSLRAVTKISVVHVSSFIEYTLDTN
jgi:hypothetical protein